MGEMRLDAHLDAAGAVARYMELLKLASLIERHPRAEELPAAIAEINSLLTQAASAEQRELYVESNLDELLLDDRAREACAARRIVDERAEVVAGGVPADPRRRADAVGDRHRDLPDLPAALQVRARVLDPEGADAPAALRDPRAPGARALPHPARQPGGADRRRGDARADAGQADDAVRDRLAAARASASRTRSASCTRRRSPRSSATTSASPARRPRRCGSSATSRSGSARTCCAAASTAWTAIPDGSYELIDYKTGRARTPSQLKDDIQLSLYQIGAKESWKLESSRQSYYYVLDDEKVPLEPTRGGRDPHHRTRRPRSRPAILAQEFEPTPSYSACSICDFQLICPAAER